MSDKSITTPDWVKTALEFIPVIVFLAVYLIYRTATVDVFGLELTGLLFATLVTIPVILTTVTLLKLLFGKVPPMQMVMAVMITVFGGLAVWLNDERFIKIRPTLVYSIFAAILIFGNVTGRYYLKKVMDDQVPMADEGWRKLSRRAIVFLVAMAVLNEITWRLFSDDVWVALDKIGQPIMFILFFLAQINLFVTHAGTGEKKEA